MKKNIFRLIVGLVILLSATSCLGLLKLNDNELLYGSEWSTKSGQSTVKFFKDDSVVYLSQDAYYRYSGSGTFEYFDKGGEIYFDGLTVSFTTFVSEMTGAVIKDKTTMHLYWHEIGKSNEYYEVLYRVR